ncbi:MAG: LamG domain-containing protein, partial [Verrucomicrobiota bacterium]
MKGWSISSCILLIGFSAVEAGAERTDKGLLVLYDFASAEGSLVKDRSGAGRPINLRITQMQGVKRSKGQLEIRGKTLVRSEQPATRVAEAIQRSGALSVEAWIEPFTRNLSGPARIVSLSGNTTQRNFTLGQDGDAYDCRLRTSRTSNNGLPSLASRKQSLVPRLTHVVYTRDRDGKARIYLDGKQNAARDVGGDLKNWDKGFHLALANEHTSDRPWQGRYHLVALYSRSL